MDILFKNKALQKSLTDIRKLQKEYGKIAKRLKYRLAQLRSVTNLAELRFLPGVRCHQLTGTRKEQFAVTVSGKDRIVFEVMNDPIPRKEDGGIDWQHITEIRIVFVGDYH